MNFQFDQALAGFVENFNFFVDFFDKFYAALLSIKFSKIKSHSFIAVLFGNESFYKIAYIGGVEEEEEGSGLTSTSFEKDSNKKFGI